MNHEELAEFLTGKTIKEVVTGTYLGWVVVHTLIFDDGSELELAGNADVAYAAWVQMPGESCTVPMICEKRGEG